MKRLFSLSLISLVSLVAFAQSSRISLDGLWHFSLDPDSVGRVKGYAVSPLAETVMLPGTTDTNKKGIKNNNQNETTHLTRHFSYFGKAWYQRKVNVPTAWKRQQIKLFLERTKPTILFIDGKEVGRCDDISVPQVYDLTGVLTPGIHTIALMVDNGNSVPKQLLGSSHAYTEDTQTNWNGIIGKMYLEASESPVVIRSIMTHPVASENKVHVELTLSGNQKQKFVVKSTVYGKSAVCSPVEHEGYSKKVVNADGTITLSYTVELGKNAMNWSEWTPNNLYTLKVTVACSGKAYEKETVFGLCDFKAKGNHFTVNGRTTFLRGKHDACVFPLTGHVAMGYDEWYRYLSICRQYGINHVRFHSWCPPEACFEAADELGIYLQPELPIWGGFDEKDLWLTTYLRDEGRKIIAAYGNHPSFVMMGLGNELWGSTELMADYVTDFRCHDDIGYGCRRLYTFGSNMYLGYKGVLDGMDYFTSCRIGGEAWGDYNTHVRGSFSFCDAFDGGLINHEYPNTTTNFEKAINGSSVPIISHETGQFQTYPDFDEIDKYRGVLYPYNMMVFRDRLAKAGMATQAKDFHTASGKWSVELYKADIEMDLRTRNMAGFQLLDIQDYPGQGSAYVGILDAFMDSKNMVRPGRWREWCNDVVPLAELPRFTYSDGDTIRWNTLLASYTANDNILKEKPIKWEIFGPCKELKAKGSDAISYKGNGVSLVSSNSYIAALSDSNKPEVLTLVLSIDGTEYKNSYSLWVYPADKSSDPYITKDIIVTDTLSSPILSKLQDGAKVLLMPRKSMYASQTVGGLVQTDYWNYRMFKTISENNKKPVSPGTLGLLVNDIAHPIFGNFPTEMHSNWQWAPIVHESRPLIMDSMCDGYRPLVQVIDNVERNHRLGLLFEFTVGKGRIMVCMSDLREQLSHPECRQLYRSLLDYMKSDGFAPKDSISPSMLQSLFESVQSSTNVQELRNISYD